MHQLFYIPVLVMFFSCHADQSPVYGLYTFSDQLDLELIETDNGVSIKYLNSADPMSSNLIQFKDCNWTNSTTLQCKDETYHLNMYLEFLSDKLLLWRIDKFYGEIDEVYLGYLNREDITQGKRGILSSYCDAFDEISFEIPEDDYGGLVFVFQDQAQDSISYKPEGIVIQSTEKLNLKSYICNRYVLSTPQGVLYTSIQENLGVKTDWTLLQVENWGLNQGPYHDILASTGYKGEVMVFRVL